MLIPLGTDRPLHRPTLVNLVLIGVNVLVFAAMQIAERSMPEGAFEGLMDRLVLDGSTLAQHPWSPLTSMFMHGSLMHLLGNMLFLWVFGANVEDRLGRVGYLAFYLFGGVAAAGLHVAFDDAPALGASGAIAAVTGAYLVLFPRTVVKCLFFLFFIMVMQVRAWWFIGAAIAWDLISQSMPGSTGVAHLAHLGGYIYGVGVALVLLWTKVLPREIYDLFTIGRQAYRRRQLKEATLATQRQVQRQVGASAKRNAEEEARAERIATGRSAVSALLSKGDLAGAARAYRELVDEYGDNPVAVTLSRRHQYDLANYLFQQRDHQGALYAYERFLGAYERDGHVPSVKLMVAVISARYLNDPVRAKGLLTGLEQDLAEEREREIARELVEELG